MEGRGKLTSGTGLSAGEGGAALGLCRPRAPSAWVSACAGWAAVRAGGVAKQAGAG